MSLTLDPPTTAVVLIDLQRGVVGRALEPHSAAAVVANGIRLAWAVQQGGGALALVHVGFSAREADRLHQPVDAPTVAPAGGMPADWTEFVPEVAALNADIVIRKRQWGAFHGTELDLQLRRRGITTIVLAGIATNFGVESTAREAWQHNYAVVIVEDACASMSAELHRFAVEKIFPRLAQVRSTTDVLAALSSR